MYIYDIHIHSIFYKSGFSVSVCTEITKNRKILVYIVFFWPKNIANLSRT